MTSFPEHPFNPFDPATYANFHDRLAYLREHEPVYWLPELNVWCVSRYDDAAHVFTHSNFIKRGWTRMVDSAFGEGSIIGDFLFFKDPPDQTRLRALVVKAFSTRVVDRLRVQAEQVVSELLSTARSSDTFDIVSDYAWRIPIAVLASLFDLPSTDYRLLEGWGRDLFLATDSARPDMLVIGKAALQSMFAYFDALITDHRTHPTGAFIDDLIAAQEKGDFLSQHELIVMSMQLVIGGYDTTANQIANGIFYLLTYRENWELLRTNPNLISQAVEEIIRYEPATPFLGREALEEVTLQGKTIHAGALLGPLVAAANRDPRRFENPDRFDITRRSTPHLSFGKGIHACVGAPLARLDAAIAISALIQQFPKLELTETVPTWRPSFLFRGLERLPVALNA